MIEIRMGLMNVLLRNSEGGQTGFPTISVQTADSSGSAERRGETENCDSIKTVREIIAIQEQNSKDGRAQDHSNNQNGHQSKSIDNSQDLSDHFEEIDTSFSSGKERAAQEESQGTVTKEAGRLDLLYKAYHSAPTEKERGEIFMQIYKIYERLIVSAVRRYRSLSTIHDDEDLLQDGYVGLLKAIKNFRKRGRDLPSQHMKFSTYLNWCVTNAFQQDVGSKDKVVEIRNSDGRVLKVMEYGAFMKVKKTLAQSGLVFNAQDGLTFNSVQRIGYLEDMVYEPVYITHEAIEQGFIMIEEMKGPEEAE
jgi:hypothetical protein